MVDLVMIAIFAWRLHGMAVEKGLSAWAWVTRFISGYFVFGLLVSLGLVWYYGKEAFSNIETLRKTLFPFTPFFLLFLVVWFIFLRSRILKSENVDIEDTDFTPQDEDSVPEKKDLSYFR